MLAIMSKSSNSMKYFYYDVTNKYYVLVVKTISHGIETKKLGKTVYMHISSLRFGHQPICIMDQMKSKESKLELLSYTENNGLSSSTFDNTSSSINKATDGEDDCNFVAAASDLPQNAQQKTGSKDKEDQYLSVSDPVENTNATVDERNIKSSDKGVLECKTNVQETGTQPHGTRVELVDTSVERENEQETSECAKESDECITGSTALQLVHLDHPYLADPSVSNTSSDPKLETTTNTSTDTASVGKTLLVLNLLNKDMVIPQVKAGKSGTLRQILKGEDRKSSENDNQASIPDAALIQKHFQDMLAMTSLHLIEDSDDVSKANQETKEDEDKNEEGEEKLVSDEQTDSADEGSEFNTTDEEDDNDNESATSEVSDHKVLGISDSCGIINHGRRGKREMKHYSKSTSSLCSPKIIEHDVWSRVRREIEEGLRQDALLCHVYNKMIDRWAEYLKLTADQLFRFELENAHRGAAPEVIEMLEDRGRYVWQLVEDIMESKTPL